MNKFTSNVKKQPHGVLNTTKPVVKQQTRVAKKKLKAGVAKKKLKAETNIMGEISTSDAHQEHCNGRVCFFTHFPIDVIRIVLSFLPVSDWVSIETSLAKCSRYVGQMDVVFDQMSLGGGDVGVGVSNEPVGLTKDAFAWAVAKRMRAINIRVGPIFDYSTLNMLITNPNIVHMSIKGRYSSPGDDKRSYEMVFARNRIKDRKLRSLEIQSEYYDWLSPSMLEAILWNCGHLESLCLRSCGVTEHSVKLLCPLWANLHTLALSTRALVTRKSLILIAGVCKRLHTLDFDSGTSCVDTTFPSRGLTTLVRSNPGLRSLRLKFITTLGEAGFVRVLEHCPQLTSLYTQELRCHGDGILRAIAANCGPNLESLSIVSLYVTDPHCLLAAVRACPRLKVLNMNYLSATSNDVIAAIAETCPELTELRVGNYNQVTSEGVQRFAASIGPRLECLEVHRSHSIDDNAWYALAQKCFQLRYLNVREATFIEDRTFSMMVQQNPALTHVDVSCCRHLTDDSVRLLALDCRHLQKLFLSEVVSVSDASLAGLATRCPMLKELCIEQCVGVTDVTIEVHAAHHIAHGRGPRNYVCNFATNCQNVHFFPDLKCQGLSGN